MYALFNAFVDLTLKLNFYDLLFFVYLLPFYIFNGILFLSVLCYHCPILPWWKREM